MSTKIEWADDTANAATGCSEARLADGSMSPECANCYARMMSARQEAMGNCIYNGVAERKGGSAVWTGVFRWSREMLAKRFNAMRPGQRVFLGSMTDLWHPSHEEGLRAALADEIRWLVNRQPQDRPKVITLTKRAPELLAWQREFFPEGLPAWHWAGVTAGTQASANERINSLLRVKTRGPRVLSAEPLLGPLDLTDIQTRVDDLGRDDTLHENALTGDFRWEESSEETGNHGTKLGWVIVGGESGSKARPMHPDWARKLRDQCVAAGVPFFFKQWGEWLPEDHAHVLPDNVQGAILSGKGPPGRVSVWNGQNRATVFRVGKATAGRLLDGCTWNEVPE